MDVDLVCVQFRTPDLAEAAVTALVHPRVKTRVLVDVASPTPGRSLPGVTRLGLPDNPGFGAAANRGAEAGRAPWILFLNPDCRLGPSALEELLAVAHRSPRIAAVGPRLVRHDGREDRSHGVRLQSFLRGFDRPRRQGGSPRPVDWLAATCLLVRRSAFEAVGGFDRGFFLYCEDADLGERFRHRGWLSMLVPRVELPHRGGVSFRDEGARRAAYREGRSRYLAKHAGRLGRALWSLWTGIVPGLTPRGRP